MFFTGDVSREQYENSDAFHRLPGCAQHWHVLRGIVVQHRRFLRLLAVWRANESLDHSEPKARRGSGPIGQVNDRCCHLSHLRSPILRSDGNYLEEPQTIFQLEETARRIPSPYADGDLHGRRGDRYSKPRSVYLFGRRCVPIHSGFDVPLCDRTGHRVGTRERFRGVLLEALEERSYHPVRRVGFHNRNLRQHPGDHRRGQMKRRVRRSCGATE